MVGATVVTSAKFDPISGLDSSVGSKMGGKGGRVVGASWFAAAEIGAGCMADDCAVGCRIGSALGIGVELSVSGCNVGWFVGSDLVAEE